MMRKSYTFPYAAVNGYLELNLLKDRQRFNAISTSILRYINLGIGESSPNLFFKHVESLPSKIWSTVNLVRTGVLLFYYCVYLKVNLDLEKTNQLGESSPNFIFAAVNRDPFVRKKKKKLMVNLDLTILLKRWTEVKTWGGRFMMPFDACIICTFIHSTYSTGILQTNSGYNKYAKVAGVHYFLYNCTPNISRSADASVGVCVGLIYMYASVGLIYFLKGNYTLFVIFKKKKKKKKNF